MKHSNRIVFYNHSIDFIFSGFVPPGCTSWQTNTCIVNFCPTFSQIINQRQSTAQLPLQRTMSSRTQKISKGKSSSSKTKMQQDNKSLHSKRTEFATLVDFVIDEDRNGRLTAEASLPSYEELVKRTRGSSKSTSQVHCPQCNKLLSCRGNLNRHMKTAHYGHKIYCNAPGCGLSFGQAHDLRRHMRRKHGIN